MEFFFKGILNENEDILRCPFLRNINQPTNFSFSAPINVHNPTRSVKGPIFEDGPNFELAFKLFHGRNGVVPLAGRDENLEPDSVPQFNPLAAKAATISLSAFGPGGPFSFDFFSKKFKKQSNKSSNHEASSNEWLESGQCPIAKSYRAVNHVLPLVANALKPPPGMKLKCPPAIMAARGPDRPGEEPPPPAPSGQDAGHRDARHGGQRPPWCVEGTHGEILPPVVRRRPCRRPLHRHDAEGGPHAQGRHGAHHRGLDPRADHRVEGRAGSAEESGSWPGSREERVLRRGRGGSLEAPSSRGIFEACGTCS